MTFYIFTVCSFLFVIIFFVIIFEKPCLRKDNKECIYVCMSIFSIWHLKAQTYSRCNYSRFSISKTPHFFFYFPFCCRGKFSAICFWWCCFIVDRNELKYFLKRLSQSTFIRVHRIMYISCTLTHNYLQQKTRNKK